MAYPYMAPQDSFSIYGLRTPDANSSVNANVNANQMDQMDQMDQGDMDAFMNYNTNRTNTQQHQQQQQQQQQYQFDPSSIAATPFVQPPPELPQSPPDSLQPSEGHGHARLGGSGSGSGGAVPGSESVIRSSEENEKEELELDAFAEPDKRKAQNRAAQRAFRERKERHVKELETKVSGLEGESTRLRADNDRLKHELARVTAENEILRAVSGSGRGDSGGRQIKQEEDLPRKNEHTTGPMKYNPIDLTTSPDLVSIPTNSNDGGQTANGVNPRHRVTFCSVTGDKLLDTSATWDLIQSHELSVQGLVDMEDLSARLKNMAKCNGQGPAFREGEVRRAIEGSARV